MAASSSPGAPRSGTPRASRTLRTWSVLMPNARPHRAIDHPARVYRIISASWSISRLGPPVPIGFLPGICAPDQSGPPGSRASDLRAGYSGGDSQPGGNRRAIPAVGPGFPRGGGPPGGAGSVRFSFREGLGPGDLAAHVRWDVPAPLRADRLDEQQAASGLGVVAGVRRYGRLRAGVPDQDDGLCPVG